jgi:nicotinamidase-related amidase
VSEPWLVAVDFQRVFGDPTSPWCAPRYAAAAANAVRLAEAHRDHTVFTRFVAPERPTGAWEPYYREFPWALQPADSALYELTDDVASAASVASTVVTATTFGKWNHDLRAHVGDQPRLVVAGVATDCCVISTVLAAADSGAEVTVVTDACAGSSDGNHTKALDVMALYGPLVSLATTDELLAGRPSPVWV